MPKGPNGQKRPADAIGAAVMVGRIATGEIEDCSATRPGAAGGRARAETLPPKKRSEIASLAADKRWQKKGLKRMQTAKTEAGSHSREAVRMYPNNSLGPQVREFDEAFSGFEMLRELVKKD